MIKVAKVKTKDPIEQLITDSINKGFPKVGDVIQGVIVNSGKNEVIIDVPGVTTGVVRGWEINDESGQIGDLIVGAEVQATVLDLENERGMMELSFRVAGHKQAWDNLKHLEDSSELVSVKALEANKGGLIVELGKVLGFLPVSQLNSEHYPRVEGGNKSKILERLKEYVGEEFKVKVIDVDEVEEKLIVSEKIIDTEGQMAALAGYNVADELDVKVSGIVDFGLFVELPACSAEPQAKQGQPSAGDSEEKEKETVASKPAVKDQQTIEGLVHISEVSWQRVDNLRTLYNVGDKVKAKIIDITNAKVSLSIKRLLPDPWQEVGEHYSVGQVVEGKVIKINDFGAFVELGHNIHGLAHISELATAGDQPPLQVGETNKFKIINIEPEAHRLGLSRQFS